MEVKHKINDSVLSVALVGELDETAAEKTRVYIDGLIAKYQPQRVIFDLKGLMFMDSTGIGVLIGRYKNCKKRGISVMIYRPSDSVDKLLNLSGLYAVMPKL